MRPGFLTRRSLLAGTLGVPLLGRARAAAAGIAGAATELAQPHEGPGEVVRSYPAGSIAEVPLGRLAPSVRSLVLARPAELVGLTWEGPPGARLELRFRSPGGAWSRWVPAGDRGHGPPGDGAAMTAGEPVWTSGARELQLRSSSSLAGARLQAVSVRAPARGRASASAGASEAASLPLAAPVLAAGPGQPPIIARRAWADGKCPPRRAPFYGAVELAFVHHTDNPDGYSPEEVPAMLRAVYLYHRFVRGWNDIGYNFVIDLYGRVWEARAGGIDESVVGSQAGGYNVYSSGVAVLGTFSDVPVSEAARRTLEALLAWKLSLHGAPTEGTVVVQVDPAGASYSRFPAGADVELPRIAGHRQADTTDCPGSVLFGELPAIRAGATAQAGAPVQATIALASSSGEGSPPILAGAPAGERFLFGTLTLLTGAPLAAAEVAIQARSVDRRGEQVSETTLASAVTNEQGEWALPALPARAHQHLRALYAGSITDGAAVSEAIHADVAPSSS